MIESPCNDVCTTDPESGLCVGCGRTPNEIANWFSYSDSQKKSLLKDLKSRNNFDSEEQYNVLDKSVMKNLPNIFKTLIFPIGLILVLALTRLIPHPPNFTPMIAVAILSGFYFKNFFIGLPIVIFSMFLGDLIIGFHSTMIFTYTSLAIAVVLGIIIKNFKYLEMFIAGLIGSLSFFIITNFGAWLSLDMYEKNFNGLLNAYVLAIPFFHNTLISTILYLMLIKLLLSFSIKKEIIKLSNS